LAVLGVTEAPPIPEWILAWQRAEAGNAKATAESSAEGNREEA
jgi:hypothetical protein